jgi:PAB1-binding protein PBP1
LFGVKTGFDEELYTTKLDRSGADFAEREKRAQALANEIMRVRPFFAHSLYSVLTEAT